MMFRYFPSLYFFSFLFHGKLGCGARINCITGKANASHLLDD